MLLARFAIAAWPARGRSGRKFLPVVIAQGASMAFRPTGFQG